MAEAAGLVLGAAGVPALLISCVDSLEYITLERNYGKDYEVSLAKVSLVKGRLRSCGESISRTTATHRYSDPSPSQWGTIKQSLVRLHSCFTDEQKLQNNYGLKSVSGNMSMTASNSTTVSPSLAEVTSSFNLASIHRQKETPLSRRVWWAIHDKKKFDALISDALTYITTIESICTQVGLMNIKEHLYEAAKERMTTREGLQLLEQAIREMPSPSQKAEKNEGLDASNGHVHIRTFTRDDARVALGNAGMTSDTRHYYRDANFGGRVLAGDSSVDAVKALFG